MSEGKRGTSDPLINRSSAGNRRSLKWTLLLSFLATSLLPLVAVSTVSYIRAKDSLRAAAAYDSLAVEANAKAAFIDNWFHYRFIDLDAQATSLNNARFLGELRDEFQASGKDIGSFVKSFRWAMIADEYATDLRSFRRMYDYHDVFLIDNEGNILFTVAMKDDFGTNLFQDTYAKTRFADACRRALATGRPAFSDLHYYAASKDSAAGFMASVIVDEDGEKLCVLAIQIPMAMIDNVMAQKTGHRATYLVGSSPEGGVTLRSTLFDGHGLEENAAGHQDSASDTMTGYLDQRIDTEQARKWMEQLDTQDAASAAKVFVYDGPAGRPVLGIYKNITVGDIKWGLIAEIDEHVAFSAATGRSAMELERVSLDACVDAAIVVLESRIEDTQANIVRDSLPDVIGDKTLLTQLYQNLLGNAMKFIDTESPEIYITAEPVAKTRILGVRDNGIGMKPEFSEAVFKPFKRLHGRGKYEGTGIGLSICKKAVSRHGGRIWVESELGQGTHFKFTLKDTCVKQEPARQLQPS
jgi:hypothetical protein